MLPIVKLLFDNWNTQGVVYCNWKGTSKIYKGLDGDSDIDVLLDKSNRSLAESILTKTGYIKVRTQSYCNYSDIFDWIGCDMSSGKLVHIHLHFRMIAGHPGVMGYTLPWEFDVLRTRVLLDNNVYTIDPNWEMIIFLVRLGLEYPNKKIDKNRKVLNNSALSEYKYLQDLISYDIIISILHQYFENDSSQLYDLTQKQSLTKSDFLLLKSIVLQHFGGKTLNLYYRNVSKIKTFLHIYCIPKLFNVTSIITKKTIYNGGLVIAFLGQDGSGKSSVSKDIYNWLSWKMDVKRFYLGSGEHFNPWEKQIGNHLTSINNPIAKGIRSILSFRQIKKIADYACKNIKTAFKYREKGGVAILDRFPQTQYPSINDGPKIRSTVLPKVNSYILRKLVLHFAEREENKLDKAVRYSPDIVFKLMLSPEESIRRKPKENYESVCRKHEIIKTLSFPNSNVYEIDATQPYEQELIEIKNIIWNNILK